MVVQGPKGSTVRMCVCVCVSPVYVSERGGGGGGKGKRERGKEGEGRESERERSREEGTHLSLFCFLSHQILLVPLLPNSSTKHESSKEPR